MMLVSGMKGMSTGKQQQQCLKWIIWLVMLLLTSVRFQSSLPDNRKGVEQVL